MYLMRTVAGYSFPEIGRYFLRHHTSVIHACRHVGEALARQPELAAIVDGMRAKIAAMPQPKRSRFGQPMLMPQPMERVS
jgi:hypothetical protein